MLIITLRHPGGRLAQVPGHTPAGRFSRHGSREAVIRIPSAYRKHFNFGMLHQMLGKESFPVLKAALRRMPIFAKEWKSANGTSFTNSTPQNVGFICGLFLVWAEANPECYWEVY